MTGKVTMKVKRRVRNARVTYTAAPPARGYLVTSSAYAAAVNYASTSASRKDVQMAPPTSPPTSPTRA
jgi:hypothetical protein